MASASDHRAHAALQPADCLILLPQRLPAAVETSIGPAHYTAECTQSDAFLQPSLRGRKGRANSNSFFGRCSAAIEFRSYFVVARIAETKTTPQFAKPRISFRVRDNDRVRTGRAIFARRGTGGARWRRPGGAADRRRYRVDADDEDRALAAAAPGQPAGARAGAH